MEIKDRQEIEIDNTKKNISKVLNSVKVINYLEQEGINNIKESVN